MSIKDMVEKHLTDRGLQWASSSSDLGQLRWTQISGGGLKLDALEVSLGWPLDVQISGSSIDVTQFDTWSQQAGKGEVRWRPRWRARADNMTLRWSDKILVSDLEGTLHPKIALSNGDTAITGARHPRTGVSLAGQIAGELPHPNLLGDGELEFQIGQTITFRLDAAEVQVDHPFVAEEPLPPSSVTAEGVWDESSGALSAKGTYGAVGWTVDGHASREHIALDLSVPLTPLSTVVDLFGAGIPEARRARISGEVSLSGQLTGPKWAWLIEPGAKDLSVSDATPEEFGRPIVRWRTLDHSRCENDSDCEPAIVHHITGPRTNDWVRLADAGWMPEAVIAAEDIRFRSHPGFDLIAIQEALANAQSDERIRGGSTLTQQLAKNLFLDGRRTLRRKLRELLLALSMEDRMTKDAILTLYLNVVEFGPGIWGIGEASDAWFLKTPDQLSVREAAFLSSILPAPRMWHQRITDTGRVPRTRVNAVLDRMRRRGSLSHASHADARAETLRVVPPASVP